MYFSVAYIWRHAKLRWEFGAMMNELGHCTMISADHCPDPKAGWTTNQVLGDLAVNRGQDTRCLLWRAAVIQRGHGMIPAGPRSIPTPWGTGSGLQI